MQRGGILLHEGRRSRVKNRYLTSGLDDFQEHEVLELLLFYAIPYKDTNELAHRLLDSFGSLYAVLNADSKELSKIDGMGEHASIFLSMLPAVYKAYDKSRYAKKAQLKTIRDVVNYCKTLLFNDNNESLYCICMNNSFEVINSSLIARGINTQLNAHPRLVVSALLKNNASKLVLCHNHPVGLAKPSYADEVYTKSISSILSGLDIDFIDHIIVANDGAYSIVNKKYFNFKDGEV